MSSLSRTLIPSRIDLVAWRLNHYCRGHVAEEAAFADGLPRSKDKVWVPPLEPPCLDFVFVGAEQGIMRLCHHSLIRHRPYAEPKHQQPLGNAADGVKLAHGFAA